MHDHIIDKTTPKAPYQASVARAPVCAEQGLGVPMKRVGRWPEMPCRIRCSASLCSGDRSRRHTACGLAETGQGAIVC